MASGTKRTKYSDCRPGLIIKNQNKSETTIERWYAELLQLARDDFNFPQADMYGRTSWEHFYNDGFTANEALTNYFNSLKNSV